MLSKIFRQFIGDVSAFGALPFFLFFSFFILVLGDLQLFLELMLGLVSSYLIIIFIRIIYYKDRPEKREYKNILERIDSSSFPSLHSWRIIMLSILTGFYYKEIYLTILLSILSFLVLFSRYYLKKHYLADIIFGGIFGLIEAVALIIFL